jgi:NADH dehydrogenase
MKKICIFGANGFIGSNLLPKLEKDFFNTAVIRKKENNDSDVLPKLNTIIDKNYINNIDEIIAGHDVVINLIGILNQTKTNTFKYAHTEIPKLIASSCIHNNIDHFIHVSALGVARNSKSDYLKSKFNGEIEVAKLINNKLTLTILKPSVIFGKNDFLTKIYSAFSISPIIPVLLPNTIIQPLSIDDLIYAIRQIIDHPEKFDGSFELGGNEILRLIDLLKISLGKTTVAIPDSISYAIALTLEKIGVPLFSRDNIKTSSLENTTNQSFKELFGKNPISAFEYFKFN